jgi:hypothetical protein
VPVPGTTDTTPAAASAVDVTATDPEPVPQAERPADPVPVPVGADPTVVASTETPPSASSTDSLTLERVVAAWPSVVDLLSRQPAVKQLITTCRPIALDGVVVTLGFPEEQGFLRDVAERKRAPIEAGIGEVIGRDVAIKCVVANIEVPPPMAPDDVMAEAGRIFADVRVDVGEVS